MASDRGTMPRGMTGDQWAEPTAPGGRRMPTAPRERKPALAVLAVLLVALGAAASGYLVLSTAHKVEAIEIVQSIGPGEQIPASALKPVEVNADIGIDYVSWSVAAAVTRVFAANEIPAGTLLTPKMTVGSEDLTSGDVQEGLLLKAGAAPPSLQIGAKVQAYADGPPTPCGGTADELLVAGTVTGVAGDVGAANDTEILTLAVSPASSTNDYPLLACEAANGTVALVQMPGTGAG
jgi:hypothetical protein